ncbi:prolyl oligopeptidase family serine peptidase [Carboxylicivirga sp. N1Y90]|uniref:alpha/beta hydrolase family protein n=1 Tax=Carboxylicivirga fragile TaxID=3417571 RepID=UPI003D32B879|nr:S9 family peptidase [Marinilabiliaceae bacterium N1Y90]
MKHIVFYAFVALLLAACSAPQQKQEETFTNRDIKVESPIMTPEVLWSFGRVGSVAVSPDGQTVAFTISYTKIEENKTYSDIYTMPAKGGDFKQITSTKGGEFEVRWRPDGAKITYMTAASGDVQLWEMNADGTQNKQVTRVKGGIEGYKYAPTMDKLVYTKSVKLDQTIHDRYPDLKHADARIEDDLMYRHWDHWVDPTYTHVFYISYANGATTGEGVDIMKDERFHSPNKPWGGMEQITFSPDGKNIAYTSKKKVGMESAFSTNSDIYVFSIETGKTENYSEGMMGYDIAPTYSPDGKYIAWESMERDGYEADQNRLFIMDLATKEKKDYTADFDQNVHGLTWTSDSKQIYFTSEDKGSKEIFRFDISNNSISQITDGIHNYNSVAPAGDMLIATRTSMQYPTEIISVNPETGEGENISKVNEPLLAQLKMGKVEKRWIKTTDNKEMLTWVIYPPNFDSAKKYPTLLYCGGGPQSMVSQFWSLRWNFQMMAANDYIIVAPNRRGLPGFGQEWNEQISGDYGGQNMKDYLSAIDEVAKEPFVDNDNLGSIGASYGGYSVYWLAGNHNKRFSAFISHCGIFNFEQMYSTTEEMFFVDFDYKGNYWDKSNKTAMRSYANSPHNFVKNWDTPMLVIHGAKDFRIPYTQGMGAYNVAKMRGLQARFLYFPEENHWVLSCHNGILWQREFFRFLDETLK